MWVFVSISDILVADKRKTTLSIVVLSLSDESF